MSGLNRKLAVVRVTTLAAALMGVYGVAGATPSPDTGILFCNGSTACTEGPYAPNAEKNSAGWAVTGTNGAVFTLNGGIVTANNISGAKGVLSANGSNVTVDGTTITTKGASGHGVQSYGPGSKLQINEMTITTENAAYAVGVSAQVGGEIAGSNNTIETFGKFGSGVEVDRGGTVSLTGGSITTHGSGAAGARAISGSGSTTPGSIVLDGTAVTTDLGIGLMAGDVDNGVNPTAGNITYKNGTVTASGTAIAAARVFYGSTLTLENATLKSTGGNGINAGAAGTTADGSTVVAMNSSITTSAAGPASHTLRSGVAAANGAKVTVQGGSITTTGAGFTRGILVSDIGTTVETTGTAISTAGHDSHAVHAFGPSSIKLAGGTVGTSGSNSHGLYAQNGGQLESSAAITTSGLGSFGAFTYNGGDLVLRGGSITTEGGALSGVGSFGVLTKKDGSVTIDGTTIETTGQSADGLRAEENARLSAKNMSVTTRGDQARGAYATSGGSISLDNGSIKTGNAYALHADGAGALISATNAATVYSEGTSAVFADNNATIKLAGGTVTNGRTTNSANGLLASHGATIEGSGVTIVSGGESTPGATNGVLANYDGYINLTGGSVKSNSSINGRGLSANFNAKIDTNNVAVATVGSKSHAVQAWSSIKDGNGGLPSTDRPTIALTGGTVDTLGADSYGLMAQNNGSIVNATGLSVTTQGANSYGAVAYNGSAISLSNVAVKTSGENAHGISMGATSANQTPVAEPVSNVASSITVTGGSISTTGAGSSAVNLQDSGAVSLTGTTLTSAGSTFASTFMQAGQTQGITLGSGTTVAANNGELLRVTRSGGGTDGTVALNLGAGSFAQGNVYDMDGSKLVSVTKTGDAQWAGMVVDQSTQQIDPSTPPAPNYTTTENVIITSSAPVTFTGTTSMGAFSGATGGTSTFAGPTSITGNLIGAQGASTNFSGNASIGGSITSGSDSTTTFSGPSTTIGGSVGGNGGAFAFSRTGSTSIGGSLSLSGPSQVTGGTINNPITVGGDATVGAGSVLGGNLVVAGALGGSGGTLSPGNSVGTQIYGTSAEFSGAYKAEVNAAGKSDLIVISNGNFDLSNIALTVAQENGNGGYVLNHDYTIVQTPGGEVVNTFKPTPALDSSFAGTLVKLDPVKYGSKDVKVSLSVDNSAAQTKRAGLSGNQNATLDGVLSVAGKNTAADAALQSTDTAGAMNQLSGEVHASTSSALLAAGGLVQRTVAQRMRGNLGVGMTAGAPTAQAGGTPVAGSLPQSGALPLWAQVVGNWNTLSDNGNAAKVKSNMGGVFIGGDTAVGSGWRVGGALGFTDGQIDVDDRSSRTKARSYTASLYGGNSWATGKGSVNFLAGAAYTRHNLDSRRSVTLAGGQKLTADYHANSAQLFTELGYALPVGANSVVEPYAGLAWLSQRMQGFSESGGSAALRGDSQTDTVTTFTLGLRGKTTLELSADKRVTLFGGLGWRHASGDVTTNRNLALIQGNGASFQVSGAPIAKNAALVDAGVEASIGRNAALGLSYNGQYGNGNTNHVGSLYVKMRF